MSEHEETVIICSCILDIVIVVGWMRCEWALHHRVAILLKRSRFMDIWLYARSTNLYMDAHCPHLLFQTRTHYSHKLRHRQ